MSLRLPPNETLTRRMRELLRTERETGVEFLLHLAEFDRRRGWAPKYSSLWEYCVKELKLPDCATWYRTRCVRALRRFPFAADYLRDGRLTMTTLAILEKILTVDDVRSVLDRAAWKSRRDVDEIVANVCGPRTAPAEMIRKLPERSAPSAGILSNGSGEPSRISTAVADGYAMRTASTTEASNPVFAPAIAQSRTEPVANVSQTPSPSAAPQFPASAPAPARGTSTLEIEPLGADRYVVRISVEKPFVEKLRKAKDILSHVEPSGNLAKTLERALDKVLAEHEKRSTPRARTAQASPAAGAASTSPRSSSDARPTATDAASAAATKTAATTDAARAAKHAAAAKPAAAATPATSVDGTREKPTHRPAREHVPIDVEREVRARDGNRCAWKNDDGTVCGSTWKLQLDDIVPRARGGRPTVENLRILCQSHNLEWARQCFGHALIDRYAPGPGRRGERDPDRDLS